MCQPLPFKTSITTWSYVNSSWAGGSHQVLWPEAGTGPATDPGSVWGGQGQTGFLGASGTGLTSQIYISRLYISVSSFLFYMYFCLPTGFFFCISVLPLNRFSLALFGWKEKINSSKWEVWSMFREVTQQDLIMLNKLLIVYLHMV